ncbi:MAG TPA: RNA polymerase subunit sigma-70 [Phototrophicaceae bacterium]|nr:RNA polymerase subunit sigma-70 [Phototrophicaceae bacterium]
MADERVSTVTPEADFAALPQDSFQRLTDTYRYELTVHLYRILGSLEDAEDALQETLLRAWRRIDTLKAQSALRAWLYKIATNVALDMLDRRKASAVRLMPTLTHLPADPDDELSSPIADPLWLDPLPDSYLDEYQINPESRYEALENISLAFLVALQRLPGRQRAILLLCDVLDWKAQEAADALDLTVAAVNSALQRARATLKTQQIDSSRRPTLSGDRLSALLNRYVQAWETADSSSLMALLREDAALTMPPFPTWFRGREAIAAFLDRIVFAAKSDFRMMPTRANSAPAFALYQRDAQGSYALIALHVLTLDGDQIGQIDDFLAIDARLFVRFHLPVPD